MVAPVSGDQKPRLNGVNDGPICDAPDHKEPAAVLGPVKAWPGKPCIRVEGGATANLDNPCARRPPPDVGRGEGTGFKSNKGTGFREGTPIENSSPLQIDADEQTHSLHLQVDQRRHEHDVGWEAGRKARPANVKRARAEVCVV